MQTFKKAVKKLANSKNHSGQAGKPAAPQLAKKSPPTKKKSVPAGPMKKGGAQKKPGHPGQGHKKHGAGKGQAPAQKANKAPHKPHEVKEKKKPHIVHVRVAEKNPEKGQAAAGEKNHHAEKSKKPAQQAPAPVAAQAQQVKKNDKSALSPKGVEIKIRKAEAPARKKEEVVEEAPEANAAEDVVLTDAEGRRYCRVKECDQLANVDNYCRFHYLLYWKNIQVRKKILTEGKLERYIEELTARYPDKYLEMLKKDLRSEKDFMAAIQELEIDDTSTDAEYEDEAQSYLEEVRGMGGEATGGREEEDF